MCLQVSYRPKLGHDVLTDCHSVVLLLGSCSPVDGSRIPDDEISRLETGFLNITTPLRQPSHLFIVALDMVVRVVWLIDPPVYP
jgi:hypothetical protein